MPLTQEQFRKAREAGFSVEKIASFEKRRTAEAPQAQTEDRSGDVALGVGGAALVGGAVAIGSAIKNQNSPQAIAKRAAPTIAAVNELNTVRDTKAMPIKQIIAGPVGDIQLPAAEVKNTLSLVPKADRQYLLNKHSGGKLPTNLRQLRDIQQGIKSSATYDYNSARSELNRIMRDTANSPELNKAMDDYSAHVKEVDKPLRKLLLDREGNPTSEKLRRVYKGDNAEFKDRMNKNTANMPAVKKLIKVVGNRNKISAVTGAFKGAVRGSAWLAGGGALLGAIKAVGPLQTIEPIIINAAIGALYHDDPTAAQYLYSGGNAKDIPKKGTPARREFESHLQDRINALNMI